MSDRKRRIWRVGSKDLYTYGVITSSLSWFTAYNDDLYKVKVLDGTTKYYPYYQIVCSKKIKLK